jgi:hypothetical protein
MEFDRVDPLAGAVQRTQLRSMPIRRVGERVGFGGAERGAPLRQRRFGLRAPSRFTASCSAASVRKRLRPS